MVKAKRGKKPAKDGSDDSDVDNVDELAENVDQLSLKPGNAKAKQKKKTGQRAGFELLLAGESGEESADSNDDDDSASKSTSKSKSGKKFQEEDDDSEEAPSKSSKSKSGKKGKKQTVVEDDSDNSDFETKAKAAEEAKGGKKSKRKKKKEESDEDIEKILAELQMEYSGVKSGSAEPEENKGKKKGESKEKTPVEESTKPEETVQAEDTETTEGGSSVKSTAQKKREKREREKLKKQQQKQGGAKPGEETVPAADKDKPEEKKPSAGAGPEGETETQEPEEEKEEGGKKKKGKKGTATAEVKDEKKAPKKNKMIAAIQEAQKKLQEEEERLRKEAEEEEKRLQALDDARLEQERLEQERKERKKKKEKERKERLKAEGKLLTPKQKADRARAQAMLEALGVAPLPGGEKKVRPGTRIRPSKVKQQSQQQTEEAGSSESRENSQPPTTEATSQSAPVEELAPTEEVKDSWDAESSGSDAEATSEAVSGSAEVSSEAPAPVVAPEPEVAPTAEESASEEDVEEDSASDESEDSDEDLQHLSEHDRKRAKAMNRIEKRRDEAEKKRSPDNLRAAVICVLGHVDTGKTKILDKLRRTSVQAGEAGGITQQIGATNVPMDAIKEQTKIVRGFADVQLKLPGLLIIDTPGHASFSNLRSRGSSLCDMAILVVDIMHGLEEQTLESINLLKAKKTPFIVALNKIDRLYDWSTMARKDIRDVIKAQASNTQTEFERRTKDVVIQFAEQGLNAALFYDNPDPRSYVSLVPTSAITGEGMGNLLALIVENCQTMLTRRLMYSQELQATVLEVKAITGLGTTIDCILVNGRLREGETIVLASSDGNAIVTQIRSLLMPQPMKELRVKNEYIEYKEVMAAQGVKIAAKDLEKAIAGLNMLVAHHPDEVEICREEVVRDLARELGRIKLQQTGVLVQASTLGSLEALLEFLKDSKIPYSSVKIGPVVKKDVMRAASMLERDSQYGTILAFDVKIERDAQEMADSLGVKIFTADIIYHLFDQFTKHREDLRQSKRQQFKNIAVFPCKLRILPQYVFNSRDPIVAGVIVEDGIVCVGTPICVPNKEAGESAHFVDIGVVTSIESNHKAVENARRGQEVCVKIEPTGDGAPKMFGRHFDEKDFLLSKISRQSIDACKEYFREDLLKSDWQLMVELKKIFQIL